MQVTNYTTDCIANDRRCRYNRTRVLRLVGIFSKAEVATWHHRATKGPILSGLEPLEYNDGTRFRFIDRSTCGYASVSETLYVSQMLCVIGPKYNDRMGFLVQLVFNYAVPSRMKEPVHLPVLNHESSGHASIATKGRV
jgi:hypothetical protein